MMRATLLVAVAAVCAVGVMGNAVVTNPPTVFYRKETFAPSSGCTGAALLVEAGPTNYCVYSELNSTMAVIGPGGNLTQFSWAAGFSAATGRTGMCSGPFASPALAGDGELTTASGVCVGGNVKYTYPITDAGQQWATQTEFSDGNCIKPKSGPVAFQLNACIPDGTGNSFQYVVETDPSKWIKTTWTGSTTCTGTGAEDNFRYGNECLQGPPGGSFAFQYTSLSPATVMSSTANTPYSSTAGTVNPSSTGSNGAGSVLHAASALSAAVAAVAAAVAIAAL